MAALIRTFIFISVILAAFIYILYQIVGFSKGIRSTKRIIDKDLDTLAENLKELLDGLIPFHNQDFKLLSKLPQKQIIRVGLDTIEKGYLSTIYQEPLIAYAIKHYKKKDKISLIAVTELSEYQLLYSKGTTVVYVDGKKIGHISEDYIFTEIGSKATASVDSKVSNEYASVEIDGKVIAHFNDRDQATSINDRVFSLFHSFDTDDSPRLISLTLFYILIKSNYK